MGLAIGFYLVVCTIPLTWEWCIYFGAMTASIYPEPPGYPRFYRWTYWFPVLIVCALNGLLVLLVWHEESTTRVAGLVLGVIAFALSVAALFVIPWIVEEPHGRRMVRNFHDLRWGQRWGLGVASAAVAIAALIVVGVGYVPQP